MKNLNIIIASVPDRKKLVAEIWHNDIHIAEISQDNLELEVTFFDGITIEPFNLDGFIKVLMDCQNRL